MLERRWAILAARELPDCERRPGAWYLKGGLTMLTRLVLPWVLLSLCIIVHALMMTVLLRRSSRAVRDTRMRFWPITWMLIRVAGWIVAAHLVEIAIWASYYFWHQIFPNAETSFYFSAVTYTTVGYGDLVLPERWRILAGVEGLTGILMCGWSTGLLFALVNRLYTVPSEGARKARNHMEPHDPSH